MDLAPDDRDMMVRTIIGEAADQPPVGQAAVAHVILNRARTGEYGASPSSVVLAPGQFEPWSTRARELLRINPKSKEYQQAGQIVDDVAAGRIPDPTSGATHFLAPDIVRARRGGTLPDWARGPGLAIAGHTFYAPNDPNYGTALTAINRAIGAADPRTVNAMAFAQPAAATVAQDAPQRPEPGSVLERFGFGPDGASRGQDAPQPPAPAPATTVEPGSILRLFGHDEGVVQGGKMAPTPSAPGQTIQATPGVRAAATDLAASRGAIQPVVEGIPIAGPAIQAGSSALAAAVDPLIHGAGDSTFAERFGRAQELSAEANRIYDTTHPATALAGNVGGALLGGGALAATRPGAFMMGLSSPTLGGRVYTGAGGGAIINALDAAARGQDVTQAAVLGGGMGAGGALASDALRAGGNFAGNALYLRHGLPAPVAGLNSTALGHLTDRMAGQTPESVAAGVSRMGPSGFLSDLTPELTDLAGGMADQAMSPQAKAAIRTAYGQRAAESGQRIDQAITNAMGPPANLVRFERFTTEARAAAADPLYQQWRSTQVHPTEALKALIPRLEAAGAFSSAEELGGISGRPINRDFFTGGPQKAYPTTETWDLVKRGLDRRIDAAYSNNDRTLARELLGLRSNVISEIEKTDAGQIWKQARQEFADRSAILDQVQRGRDTFLGSRSGLSRDELAEEMQGLNGPERAARIMGARSAVHESMFDTLRGQTQMRDKLLALNNQDKLRFLIGEDRANPLINTLESERFLSAQDQNVRGGTQTAPKTARRDALSPPPLPQWNPSLVEPLSLIPPHVREQLRLSTMIEGSRAERARSALDQLAPILTTQPGPQMTDLVNAIGAVAARQAAPHPYLRGAAQLPSVLATPAATLLRLRHPGDSLPALVSPAQ